MKKKMILVLILLFCFSLFSFAETIALKSGKTVEGKEIMEKYPSAIDFNKVGTYPALVKSGSGYFYDEVLEYRVWIHSEAGDKDLHNGEDYFYAFATYEEALKFSKETKGAEPPLVLILQKEYINEPEEGVFEHIKEERIAEWQPDWLMGSKREKDSIARFLKNKEIRDEK